MVTQSEVDRQIHALGVKRTFIIRSEIKELRHILVPNEQIKYCVAGRYEGGFALLCATDQRILLIDKKPFYLTMEDLRYDMVSEVDFSSRLIDSSVRICTPNKDLRFRSISGAQLREMTSYLQNRVMEFRQQHMMQQPYGEQNPFMSPGQQANVQHYPAGPQYFSDATAPAQHQEPAQYQEAVQHDPSLMSAEQPQSQAVQQPAMQVQPAPQSQLQAQAGIQQPSHVRSLRHQVLNPYIKGPLMMRRRVSRFPSISGT